METGRTTSTHSEATPLSLSWAQAPGQPLDVARFYVILPDAIGHRQSSRPSEGLHARFPNYGYADMVDAEHRLVVDGLHINHLSLVMGTSSRPSAA